MKLLLDSHAVFWWVTGSDRLSGRVRKLILDRSNGVLVSAVSIYELEWKARRQRLALPLGELRPALRRNDVQELAITPEHAEYAANTDWDHKDPWDRLLYAQARLEQCALVSVDSIFDQVAVERLW